MKKILLLLVLLPGFAYGQRDSAQMAVKLNIATPFDVFYFPTIDLQLEHRIGKRFSVSGEAGYQLYRFTTPDTAFITQSGHKLKAEFRFYEPFSGLLERPRSMPMTGFYTGINLFYRAEKYNSSVMYTQKSDTTVLTDYFWIDKSAWGGNLIFGYQEIYRARWLVDGFAGIGLLERTITDSFREYDPALGHTQVPCEDIDCLFSARDLSENSGVAASFTLGFRVGYIIY